MRVTGEEEVEGLDLSQHGETALGFDLLSGGHANGKHESELLAGSSV